MVPPFLVNGDGTPYPPEMQRMVPGRENLTDALQVAVTNRSEEGSFSIIEMAYRSGAFSVLLTHIERCSITDNVLLSGVINVGDSERNRSKKFRT